MYKVLLIDDEPFAIEGLKLLIDWEKHDFVIDAVYNNGEEAIEQICKHLPDLVVTDIRMPVMDGLELIAEARRRGNSLTKFVITSGYDDFDYARQAMRLGVSNYMTKPIISEEADAMLAQLQKELREQERRILIRHNADLYEIKHALSVLLFGDGGAEKQEALLTLSHLSRGASAWTYLLIETDAESSAQARVVAQKIANECPFCVLIDCERGTFGLVLGMGEPSEAEIRAFAQRLLSEMRSVAPGRIEIAVGCCVNRLDDLSLCWSSAAEAQRFLFFDDLGLVHYSDIRDRTLSYDPGALKAADEIVEAMENRNSESLVSAIRKTFLTFEQEMMLPELVGIFTTQVVLRCTSIYKELGGDPDELLTESGFGTFNWQGGYLWESAQMLTGFCLKCQSAVSALHNKQTGGTQARIAEFLRQNYKETITIRELAEQFYMNPVYLGQSFSRIYGMSIHDFIHDLRIQEAKQLLRNTDNTSYSIAESIGYRGYQHFLKQFEKRLGMTPVNYKAQFAK